MADESFTSGDLGLVFNNAVPLSLPLVADMLRTVRDTEGIPEASRQLLKRVQTEVDEMQRRCDRDAAVQALMRRRLELDLAGAAGAENAVLARMNFDEFGNLVSADGTGGDEEGMGFTDGQPQRRTERLKPFEAVALCTLVPRSVEEAVVLLPSLSRFSEVALVDVLNSIEATM